MFVKRFQARGIPGGGGIFLRKEEMTMAIRKREGTRGVTWQIDYLDPNRVRVRQSFKKKKDAEAELGKRGRNLVKRPDHQGCGSLPEVREERRKVVWG